MNRRRMRSTAISGKETVNTKTELQDEQIISDEELKDKTDEETAQVQILVQESLSMAIQRAEDLARSHQQQDPKNIELNVSITENQQQSWKWGNANG